MREAEGGPNTLAVDVLSLVDRPITLSRQATHRRPAMPPRRAVHTPSTRTLVIAYAIAEAIALLWLLLTR